MAQRTQVVLTDDIDGSEAEETVRFGFYGTEYEIDLSKQHADQLAAAIEPYIRVARRVGSARRSGGRSAGHHHPYRSQAAVREWARAQGLKVSDRGRIPAQVIAQYEAAHHTMAGPDSEATVTGDGLYVWHLGFTQRHPPANPRTVNVGAEVADAEYDSYRSAVELLDQALPKSAFAALQERCMDYMRATSDALEAFKAGQSTTPLTPVIRGKFDDLLSAFRRFADRTAHLLSQRYGPDSEEVRVLKRAMSYEFDHEFAYRFMYHLRNYSEHRGAPIARIKQTSTLRPDSQVEHDLDVLFDSRKLLSGHDWHRHVRADLSGINGEFSAVVTVDALLQACGRVHCKALLSQEAVITAAAASIHALAGRIATDDVLGPVLVQVRRSELIARQVASPLNITPIRTDLAEVAEVALRQAHELIDT